MDQLADGHIKQDGMTFRERSGNPSEAAAYIPYPVTGQVTGVFKITDPKNRDKETWVLDVHCQDRGIDLFKVPWLGGNKGSIDNYIQFAPVASTANVDKSAYNSERIDPEISNGDTVLVVFANGNVHQPYAISTLPHNQTEKISPSPRSDAEAGDAYKVRFNGTNLRIDDQGNFIIEHTKALDPNIPVKRKMAFTTIDVEGETQKIDLELDNTGAGKALLKVTGDDSKEHFICLDHATNTIELSTENDNGTNLIKMKPDCIEINTPKLVKVVAGENAQIDVTGTTDLTSSGDVSVTTQANANVMATGNINATASGNIVATGAQIQLNGSAGQVLTTVTDPVIDLITGAPTTGVPTVLAG